MAVALLIARLPLAFAVAGAAKLADLAGSPRALEVRVKTKGPRLVLVSTGTVEANRASRLSLAGAPRSELCCGPRPRRHRHPSAVLADDERKIASGIAVGGPSVLELAESRAEVLQGG
jgi:hypothetical protein